MKNSDPSTRRRNLFVMAIVAALVLLTIGRAVWMVLNWSEISQDLAAATPWEWVVAIVVVIGLKAWERS
jgi:hypothetical protein